MLQEIKNIKATDEIVRKFGIILAILLGVFGSISLWKSGMAYRWLYPAGGIVLVGALLFPGALKYLYIPWMVVATVIGWCVTRVILGVFYYGVMTPFGVVGRMVGKHFLDEKLDPAARSYWVPRTQKKPAREDLERQF